MATIIWATSKQRTENFTLALKWHVCTAGGLSKLCNMFMHNSILNFPIVPTIAFIMLTCTWHVLKRFCLLLCSYKVFGVCILVWTIWGHWHNRHRFFYLVAFQQSLNPVHVRKIWSMHKTFLCGLKSPTSCWHNSQCSKWVIIPNFLHAGIIHSSLNWELSRLSETTPHIYPKTRHMTKPQRQ